MEKDKKYKKKAKRKGKCNEKAMRDHNINRKRKL